MIPREFVPMPEDRAHTLRLYREIRSYGRQPLAAIGAISGQRAEDLAGYAVEGLRANPACARRYLAARYYHEQVCARTERRYWQTGRIFTARAIAGAA